MSAVARPAVAVGVTAVPNVRRIAAIAAIAAGVWLVALSPIYSLWRRTEAADHVTNAFRATLSPSGIAQLDRNYAVIRSMGLQYVGGARPALIHAFGVTPAAFDRRFPAQARATRDVPGAIKLVDGVTPQLDRVARSGDFAKVDAIPGLGLPVASVPWILLGLGGALVGCGAWALADRRRAPVVAGLALSAGIVVASFGFHLPAKFDATARTVVVGRQAVSPLAAATATRTVNEVQALTAEVHDSLVPALARHLHVSQAAVGRLIATKFPAVATGLQRWPSIEPGASALAAAQRANVVAFRNGDGAPFRTLPWLLIGPAALVALAFGVAFALARRR